MTTDELDRFYSEDFYNIIVDIQPMNRSIYILLVVIFSLIMNLLFLMSMIIGDFLL